MIRRTVQRGLLAAVATLVLFPAAAVAADGIPQPPDSPRRPRGFQRLPGTPCRRSPRPPATGTRRTRTGPRAAPLASRAAW